MDTDRLNKYKHGIEFEVSILMDDLPINRVQLSLLTFASAASCSEHEEGR